MGWEVLPSGVKRRCLNINIVSSVRRQSSREGADIKDEGRDYLKRKTKHA